MISSCVGVIVLVLVAKAVEIFYFLVLYSDTIIHSHVEPEFRIYFTHAPTLQA